MSNGFSLVVKIVVHLLPLIPLALGLYYLAAAIALLVLTFYIKSRKIVVQLEHEGERMPPHERQRLEVALRRWQVLTFDL